VNDLDLTRTIGADAASGPEDAQIRANVRGALDATIAGRRPGVRRGRRLVGFAATAVCVAVVGVLFVASNKTGPSSAAPKGIVYTATATVLEQQPGFGGGPPHGPQLCLGGMLLSYPPQCGGPDIVGWDWNAAPATRAGSTRWGEYVVVGTFDGQRFTLTEPQRVAPPSDRPAAPDPFTIPTTSCPEPAGGWLPLAAAEAGRDHALTYISRTPDRSAFWFDRGPGRPTSILNVRFARDASRHEAELRKAFRGNLCVTQGGRSNAELTTIQSELFAKSGPLLDAAGKPLPRPGVLSGSVSESQGVLELQVVLDTGELQRSLEARYGAGTVDVQSALQPV
jgi:hypothetical protein